MSDLQKVADALWAHPLGGLDTVDGPNHPIIQSLARCAIDAIAPQWQPMDTAPTDGIHCKHCILAVPSGGGFVFSIQGAFMNGKWMNAADINAEPLCWMPNVRIPDQFLPWKNITQSGGAA